MKYVYRILGFLGITLLTNCKKLIAIDPPTSTITTNEVFADSVDANSALLGIYNTMDNTGVNPQLTSGILSLATGTSSDELICFQNNSSITPMYTNTITSGNGYIANNYWAYSYQILYQANACIGGLEASTGLTQVIKNQLIGEAEFIRAFVNFYLVNLFGDVPLVNTTNYNANTILARTPAAQVYQSIINDLKDAQKLLPADFSISNGERTRANQWAATALLARVYLYTGDFTDAETQATNIISNTGLFNLDSSLNAVFLKNSNEAILQWNRNSTSTPPWNATVEGYVNIPRTATNPPVYYLSPQLLGAFEDGDQRKIAWIDSTTYQRKKYYYPFKYKTGPAQAAAGLTPTEYYMVLRLAEQYLIRAEARAEQNINLTGAINDINTIRNRAGLTGFPDSLSQAQVLAAVAQERRIELFAEWGNRWFDLKRTNQIDPVMSLVNPQKNGGHGWNSYQQLYPIPSLQLSLDINLRQNSGY